MSLYHIGNKWRALFEEIGILLTQECMVPNWFKLDDWFLRRTFLNFIDVSLLFNNNPPLENGVTSHLNNLEFLLPKNALRQVLLKVVREKIKLWKFTYRLKDGRTSGDQKSSLDLRWAYTAEQAQQIYTFSSFLYMTSRVFFSTFTL